MFDSLTNRKSFRISSRTVWAEEFRQMMAPLYRPDLASVLDCLASDASSVEYVRDFEDWAGELGYDSDSRKAEEIFNMTERQSKELRYVLGSPAYEELMQLERL